jgi:hypothetical protein
VNRLLYGLITFSAANLAFASNIALEANFMASFSVYSSPTSQPALAYSVPSGKNLSYLTGNEVADDVELGGRARILANISFEYYANYALADGLTFRMYDWGRDNRPGDEIYSVSMDVRNEGAIVNISFGYNLENVLPEKFFFSVEVAGTGGGKVAGLIIPDRKATVGDSDDQAWERVNGEWQKLTLSERPPKVKFERRGQRNRIGLNHRPHTRVVVESSGHLDEVWRHVTELRTDANGDVDYETPDEEDENQKFYRLTSD